MRLTRDFRGTAQTVYERAMLATLSVVAPVFLVILCGWTTVRLRFLSHRATDGLSEFVFVVAVPILLFRTLATSPLPDVQPFGYWAAYFIAMALVWTTGSLLAARVFGLGGRENAIIGFATGQSNTVFVGIPLILRAVGDAGMVPSFLLIAIHLPLAMAVATLLIEGSDGNRRPGAMLRKLAGHPILIGIVAGALWRLTGLPLPAVVDVTTKLIGEAAAPCALFALGMTLNRYGLSAPPLLLGVMVFLKLVLQPAAVYLLAFHVIAMPPVWAAVAVLFAACPTGVNAYLLAQNYRSGEGLTAAAITLSTVCAAVTCTFWVWLVAMR
jgi:malonate transporter and related proteins